MKVFGTIAVVFAAVPLVAAAPAPQAGFAGIFNFTRPSVTRSSTPKSTIKPSIALPTFSIPSITLPTFSIPRVPVPSLSAPRVSVPTIAARHDHDNDHHHHHHHHDNDDIDDIDIDDIDIGDLADILPFLDPTLPDLLDPTLSDLLGPLPDITDPIIPILPDLTDTPFPTLDIGDLTDTPFPTLDLPDLTDTPLSIPDLDDLTIFGPLSLPTESLSIDTDLPTESTLSDPIVGTGTGIKRRRNAKNDARAKIAK